MNRALTLAAVAMLFASSSGASARYSDETAATAGLNALSVCRTILHSKSGIRAQDGVVCFFGEINKQTAAKFLDQPFPEAATVVLQSNGGDVDAALDMAERIIARKATVVIYGMCFSSCGNYLFTAGVRKIVLPRSFVGWHGGPGHPEDYPSISPTERQMVARSRSRSDAFLARQGISPDLLYKPAEGSGFDQAHQETMGWSLPPDKIEALGVHGIVYFWTAHSREGETITIRPDMWE